jgi:predicted nuclease of predicted toxin-antitoxin system
VTVAFYFDQHVDGAITKQLRVRGVDVLTLLEDGRESAPDDDVLDRGIALGRVVVTEDQDFLGMVHRRLNRGEFVGVIFIQQQHWHRGQLIEALAVYALTGNPEDFQFGITWV